MNRLRLLLADDHTLMRAGLRKLLEALPEVEVVGEASDGLELLALAERMEPDIVLMDVAMPGLNGLDCTARLTQARPGIRVLVLSMYQTEEYVRQALRNGAAAYVLKDAAPAELLLAVKAVLRGEVFLSPGVSKGVVSDYVQRLRGEDEPSGVLTARQREVLTLIAMGKGNKEIARVLDISLKTVDTHRSQLIRQLNIHDTAGLVRYAIRIGLVSTDI